MMTSLPNQRPHLIRLVVNSLSLRLLRLGRAKYGFGVDRHRVGIPEESNPQETIIIDPHHFASYKNIVALFYLHFPALHEGEVTWGGGVST